MFNGSMTFYPLKALFSRNCRDIYLPSDEELIARKTNAFANQRIRKFYRIAEGHCVLIARLPQFDVLLHDRL